MAVFALGLSGLAQRKAAPLGVSNRRKRNTKLLLRDRDESDKERERERSDELSPPPAGSNSSKPSLWKRVSSASNLKKPNHHQQGTAAARESTSQKNELVDCL